jgi:hypothetical protein
MNTCGSGDVTPHAHDWAPGGGEWLTLLAGRFILGKMSPRYLLSGGWMGLGSGLDVLKKIGLYRPLDGRPECVWSLWRLSYLGSQNG